ncbi:major facilitator superfamily domain-containing protein [Kalaharituber pfeilii]|nr:major facilitator superfamily domain-containing protein [Kalaharituber pfeilii]
MRQTSKHHIPRRESVQRADGHATAKGPPMANTPASPASPASPAPHAAGVGGRADSTIILHYQTFPTKPPSGKGRPLPFFAQSPPSYHGSPARAYNSPSLSSADAADEPVEGSRRSPAPARQLVVLALISLAEQTALNSISPYLPDMTRAFPSVEGSKVGLYVGVIASCFAGAQVATNFLWGRLSDRIGRKPVILWGTFWTAVGFMLFGFVKTLWQAAVVQAFIGIMNGNQGVVATVLGEITDKSNQSSSFAYLPVVYGLGSILGPIMGGLLASNSGSGMRYPYLLPNIISTVLLLLGFTISMLWLEESLEQAQELPPLGKRIQSLFSITYTQTILTTSVLLLLASFFIFNLSNIIFSSLYPIFVSTPPPTGRGLSPHEIGITLSFAGLAAILIQICANIGDDVQSRWGNKWCYRAGMLGMALSFFAMPVASAGSDTAHRTGTNKWLLYGPITLVLLLKSVANVVGLTCAMIMFTNASPEKKILGRINGLAQTLSAAGRAVGPFLSGGLWSLVEEKLGGGSRAGWLAWGVFGSVAVLGVGLAAGIRGGKVEGAGDEEEEEESNGTSSAIADDDDDEEEQEQEEEEEEQEQNIRESWCKPVESERGERVRLLSDGRER